MLDGGAGSQNRFVVAGQSVLTHCRAAAPSSGPTAPRTAPADGTARRHSSTRQPYTQPSPCAGRGIRLCHPKPAERPGSSGADTASGLPGVDRRALVRGGGSLDAVVVPFLQGRERPATMETRTRAGSGWWFFCVTLPQRPRRARGSREKSEPCIGRDRRPWLCNITHHTQSYCTSQHVILADSSLANNDSRNDS